jgi:transposase
MPKKTKPMTVAEKTFIMDNPFNLTDHRIAATLNRDVKEVREFRKNFTGRMPRWTDEEVQMLKTMVANNFTDQEIAKQLDRTVNSVWGKKQRLGLLSKKRGRPRKKSGEEIKVRELTSLGFREYLKSLLQP